MFKNNPLLYYLTYWLSIQPALTQTTSCESKCLTKYAKNKTCLVEIGIWHGVNTRKLREVMNTEGTIYAIDPFEPGKLGISWQKLIAHSEASKTQNGNIIWLEEFSHQAIEKFKQIEAQPIDFMFIDGDHSYEGIKTDWILWSPLVRCGGIIALHDSRSYEGRNIDHVGAAQYTQNVILKDERYKEIDHCDSLTVVQRVS